MEAVDDGPSVFELNDEFVAVEITRDDQHLCAVEATGCDHVVGQGCGGRNLGLALNLEVLRPDGGGGGITDSGAAQQAEGPDVVVDAMKFVEEIPHPVRAGEHDPIVTTQFTEHIDQGILVDFRGYRDER